MKYYFLNEFLLFFPLLLFLFADPPPRPFYERVFLFFSFSVRLEKRLTYMR